MSFNDSADAARDFVEKYDWSGFPTIDDEDQSVVAKWGVAGHPAVVLVDEQGGIVGGFYGEGTASSWDELAAGL